VEDPLIERWRRRFDEADLRDDVDFDTVSSVAVPPVAFPPDVGVDPRVGAPGEYPFTRGIHPSGYRGRLWTMRQFAGYGTARETNARFRFLADQGQTGLSIAFDMPTLMGRDSDDPMSEGEVGRCGVSVDSLADMELLFEGIDLASVSTSMTISGPAPMLFAMYLVAAEKQGADISKLQGTCQTDILKEYIAQKEWLFPPEPHLRLTADMMAFCAEHVPKYHPLSISGYHIREAGSTAVQELAYTLASGFAHVELGLRRGLDVDAFAPGLSFFFNSHVDFFEEVAKFRAGRRIWARRMREDYGARDPRSWMLRFHTQTAGVSLTAQQPFNNVARTALEALAAVLGGTQSLHTNSLDEVLALPTEEAAEIALRTQQIIAYETGVSNVADPLGGSYYVEALTDQLEREAEGLFAEIEAQGGVVKAIESGWFQRQIAHSSMRFQAELEQGRRTIVGVNDFVEEAEGPVEILKVGDQAERTQRERMARLRATRDLDLVGQRLEALRQAATEDRNIIPAMLDCARAYCTLFEIRHVLEEIYGSYREPVFF
jgi:methylmalonyl-CoA mutase, N-terminal domain